MTDLERAKDLFQSGAFSCVLCKGDVVHSSRSAGIAPMVDFIDSGVDLKGFSAADKIVGKAAALLFILAGVADVHAEVMSEEAAEILRKNGVSRSFDQRVPAIVNRMGTGLCPMEQAVRDVQEPAAALDEIKRALDLLKKNAAKSEIPSVAR